MLSPAGGGARRAGVVTLLRVGSSLTFDFPFDSAQGDIAQDSNRLIFKLRRTTSDPDNPGPPPPPKDNWLYIMVCAKIGKRCKSHSILMTQYAGLFCFASFSVTDLLCVKPFFVIKGSRIYTSAKTIPPSFNLPTFCLYKNFLPHNAVKITTTYPLKGAWEWMGMQIGGLL